MIKKSITATLNGADGQMIVVEAHLSQGLPMLNIVGLTDKVIKESKARIRSAIINSGFKFPMCRITINLSPADKSKKGSHFDLPIAIAILASVGEIKNFDQENYAFFGELNLAGDIKGVSGMLPLVLCEKEGDIKNIIVAEDNKFEAAMVQGVNVLPAKTLKDVIEHLNGVKCIEPFERKFEKNKENLWNRDFNQVYGQENVKRAMVIGATGGHNIMMMGSPGVGKTMMARRFPDILPPMSYEEAIEVTKIYSVAGLLNREEPIIVKRPFRQPYTKTSEAALIGGGGTPKPGEISLAHRGVLFLDEFLNFDIKCIEKLRQPLEEKKIYISRVRERIEFPADFIMIGATNPCQCGYEGDDTHVCTCSPRQIASFMEKMSGPLLDRIDIHVRMATVDYKLMKRSNRGLGTETMKKMVERGRRYQTKRWKGARGKLNGQLGEEEIKKYCEVEEEGRKLLAKAYDNMGLSVRSYNKILKISRTIADLDESPLIEVRHLAEALQYREFGELYRRKREL